MEQRRRLREGQDTKKKEVDRKASKNRKIRYVVHDKIVNFMTPLENLYLTVGKDNIVANLFGHSNGKAEINGKDKDSKKKQKMNGKRLRGNKEDEDEIRLI